MSLTNAYSHFATTVKSILQRKLSDMPSDLGLGRRLVASGIHLGLCVLVAVFSAVLVFQFWFPMPYREISGGRELFYIVVAVDVVLGPMLTFAVFDTRKPKRELRRDLVVVAFLQLGGLIYGLQAVFAARPVVLALETDRLRVVVAAELDAKSLEMAPPEFRALPLHGVQVVATRSLNDGERSDALAMALAGFDVGQRPEFWLPASQTNLALISGAKPVAELLERYPGSRDELNLAFGGTGLNVGELRYLPILARSTNWVALLDARSGSIVGYAPVDGFR